VIEILLLFVSVVFSVFVFLDRLNVLVKILEVNDGVFVGVDGVGTGVFLEFSENDGFLGLTVVVSVKVDGFLENKGVSGLAGVEIFETDGFEQLLKIFLSRVGVAGMDGKVVLALKLVCLVTDGVVLTIGFEEEEVEEKFLLLTHLSALEKVDLLSIDGV
jgi:hypothetical protein